jgi:serine/threonine-protein kinase
MVDKLGKFELRRIVGKGADGTVYEGFDPIIERRVAIKTVRVPDVEDPESREELNRFKRGAQAAGRLHHPNIVGVYDYGETPDLAYIVMEFVDGSTLKEFTDKKELFPLPEVLRIMEELMHGLQYSHDRGVVHRDLKPSNVMLTRAKQVKIADFGIARIESSSLTLAGTVMGTPSYMAPEQFKDDAVDARTDLYASGVLLFQLLTGERPFEGSFVQLMHKALHTEAPLPSSLRPDLPASYDAVVRKAMAKDPAGRYASATEFAQALRAAFEGRTPAAATNLFSLADDDFGDSESTLVIARKPATPPPPKPPAAPAALATPKKPGSRLPLIGGAAALALLLIVAGVYFLLQRPAPPPVAPPLVAPSAAEREAAATNAFSNIPCTLLSSTDDGGIALSGVAGPNVPEPIIPPSGLKLGNSLITVQNGVQNIPGPYCAVLDALRPYHSLFPGDAGVLGLSLAGGKTQLFTGDLITVEQSMPGYAGYLTTDYFASDGSVAHLYPNLYDPRTEFAAGAAKELGNPAKGGQTFPAGAPYGTDMIISIASSTPLFTTLRQLVEPASTYVPVLQQALAAAQAQGAQITVSALPVVTKKR